MQDMESRLKEDTRERMLETNKHVHSTLAQVKAESQYRDDLGRRVDEFDLKMNGHFLTSLQKNEKDLQKLLERVN